MPRLEEILYEPWQLSKAISQSRWDEDYERTIGLEIPKSVKKVTVFEDFNEHYLHLFKLYSGDDSHYYPDGVRKASPHVGAAFASRSRELEHLSVAYLADAHRFFYACKRHWIWDELKSLTLTSRVMSWNTSGKVNKLLEMAA
jgi:hypothetical protein